MSLTELCWCRACVLFEEVVEAWLLGKAEAVADSMKGPVGLDEEGFGFFEEAGADVGAYVLAGVFF